MTHQHSDPIINSHGVGGRPGDHLVPGSFLPQRPDDFGSSGVSFAIKIKVAFISVILIGGVVFNSYEVFFDFVVILMLTAISFHFFFLKTFAECYDLKL